MTWGESIQEVFLVILSFTTILSTIALSLKKVLKSLKSNTSFYVLDGQSIESFLPFEYAENFFFVIFLYLSCYCFKRQFVKTNNQRLSCTNFGPNIQGLKSISEIFQIYGFFMESKNTPDKVENSLRHRDFDLSVCPVFIS